MRPLARVEYDHQPGCWARDGHACTRNCAQRAAFGLARRMIAADADVRWPGFDLSAYSPVDRALIQDGLRAVVERLKRGPIE